MDEVEAIQTTSATILSIAMGLIPVLMAAYAFRLWLKTRMTGSLPLFIGLAGTCFAMLVSWFVRLELQHGAQIPTWYPSLGFLMTVVIFTAQVLTVAGFIGLCEHLVRTRRRRLVE